MIDNMDLIRDMFDCARRGINDKNNLFDACTYMLDDIIEYYYSSICGVMAQRYIDLETDINYLFSNMITQIRYYYNDIQQLNIIYEY